MRHACPVLFIVLSSCFSLSAAEPLTIREVMQQAHQAGRPTLLRRVSGGQAKPAEQARLVELYRDLARAMPPRGDAAEWQRATAEMVAAAEAAAKGEALAGQRLLQAANCAGCHNRHRPLVAIDGSPIAEPGAFATASAPELVKIANVSKDRASLSIYVWKTKLVMTYREAQEEMDGKIRTVTVPEQYEERELKEFKLATAYWRLLDATGREIAGDDIWKQLTPGTTAYRLRDAKTLDPEFQKLISPSALILAPTVLPAPQDNDP
jgi:mono/diheme cytochrome c family protein